jgi:tetratricopeptide (TPR) repeat protein
MKTRYLILFCLLVSLNSLSFVAEDGNNPSADPGQKIYSRNPEANALYIQGLEYLGKGNPQHGGSVLNGRKALKVFSQAVQKDPRFALAYLGQADALALTASFTSSGTVPVVKIYRQQEAAALKAIELDDSLSKAHASLADLYYEEEFDWPKAEKEYKRVIELTPDFPPAYTSYATFLASMGRFEEAEAQVKLAQAIDPKSFSANWALMRIYYWQRKDDAALAQAMEALQKRNLIGTHYFIGSIYIHQGQFEKGIEELKLARFGDAESIAMLAYAYARAGKKAEFESTLEQLKHHPAYDLVAYRLGAAYGALGDKDRALSLVEKSYRLRSDFLSWLKVDPTMDPLRQEPRFKKLMRKLNFEQ